MTKTPINMASDHEGAILGVNFEVGTHGAIFKTALQRFGSPAPDPSSTRHHAWEPKYGLHQLTRVRACIGGVYPQVPRCYLRHWLGNWLGG